MDVLAKRLFDWHAWADDLKAFSLDAAAGTIGGVVGIWVGSPFDVVKTRLQTGAFKSLWSCVKTTHAIEGLGGFYRGAMVSSLGQAPNNFLVFGTYGWASRSLDVVNPPDASGVSFLNVYLAGSWSGLLQSVALAPFEHIKVQQQVLGAGRQGAPHPGVAECIKLLSERGGGVGRGLMRGWVATTLRDVPTFGLYFASFEWVKWAYLRSQARRAAEAPSPAEIVNTASVSAPAHAPEVPTWVILAGGGLAGIVSWSLALPADVIKSNIQGSDISTPRSELRFLTVGRRLLAEQGPQAFLKGALPCIVRSVPVNAVTFLVYDTCLRHFTAAASRGAAAAGEPLR